MQPEATTEDQLSQALFRIAALETAGVPKKLGRLPDESVAVTQASYTRYTLAEMVTVQPLTDGSVGWTEFDCSPYLPSGAMEAEIVVEAAMDSDGLMRRYVYVRPSETGTAKPVAMLRGGSGDNVGNLTLANVPLYRDEGRLSFQHSQDDFRSVNDPDDPAGVTIYLVGYWM